MEAALDRYFRLRDIFIDTGVREAFSLPRQHALLHWVRMIKQFGSPNGVCTSIAESKHIRAVKRPWRASNRNNPLVQILRTNTRLSKLAAARAEFGRRGILRGDIVSYAQRKVRTCFMSSVLSPSHMVSQVGLAPLEDDEDDGADTLEGLIAAREDVDDAPGYHAEPHVSLARTHGVFHVHEPPSALTDRDF